MLKTYQILLLGCLLSFLITLNSNILVSQRSKNELNIEKKKLFDKIILNRRLEDGEETLKGSDKICKKGSKELIEYYKTGDLSKIKLDDKSIKCEERGKEYFDALLNILKEYIGNDNSKTSGNGNDSSQQTGDATGQNENPSPEEGEDGVDDGDGGNGRRRLNRLNRKLGFSIDKLKDDLPPYIMHIIPIVIFLVIAILSIPGWLICCFCCCCNCCCCCCCKKTGCKIPCFIFTYIFYALAVVICIYGFSQTNKIFVGLANTECSILKFFDEVLEGESKEKTPRWAGIQGINDILDDLRSQIEGMNEDTKNELVQQINNIESKENDFSSSLTSSASMFRNADNSDYNTDYLTIVFGKEFDNYKAEGEYVLDLVNMFGRLDPSGEKTFIPANSTLDAWEFEYKTVSEVAKKYITNTKDSFDQIISENTDDLLKSLKQGEDSLNELKNSFNDINSQIAEPLNKYSDTIDEYGKLGSKIVFGVLALMNVALALFILLICLFSGKMCTNCCCCRCIFKFFTHLLWNILALLMIITFLVGSIFCFVGALGSDFMNVIRFVVSEENLGKNGEGILVDKLGSAKDYLYTCINGDGNLEKNLNINVDDIKSFDKITEAEEKIVTSKEEFESKQNLRPTYNLYRQLMENRRDLTASDVPITLIPKNKDYNNEDKHDFLPLLSVLYDMNVEIQKLDNDDPHKKESWSTQDYEEDKACSSGDETSYSENVIFSPKKCRPIDRKWISDSSNENIKIRAQIISETVKKIQDIQANYLNKLSTLNDQYSIYLESYINALTIFESRIKQITRKIREYIGDGEELFSFINGKFIGRNLKIIIKYLESALGNDLKTIGICLLIVGCSLALSISSTILLIVVINIDIDNNKKLNQVPEYKIGSEGRVIQYQ